LKIVVNGEDKETRAKTLAELCAALGLADAKVATAVNGDFVPASAREAHALAQNDKVEIVSPRQGG
jgi:sulfur carrier protein